MLPKNQYRQAHRLARIFFNTRSLGSYPERAKLYFNLCAQYGLSEYVAYRAWLVFPIKDGNIREQLRYAASKRLERKYESEIRESFDFETMKDDSLWDAETNDNGDLEIRAFLGTVFDVFPSGKYHTAWANSNITSVEYVKDAAYSEALDTIAGLFGGWIESGEGDPCDLFFCMVIDSD